MKFHEIAQLLQMCRGNLSIADFVVELIENLMEEPSDDKDNEYNPIDGLVPRTLEKYFSGENLISKKAANKIRQQLSKSRFEMYIKSKKLSDDALANIVKNMKPHGINGDVENVPKICAELMEQAIIICSERVTRKKTPQKKAESYNEEFADPLVDEQPKSIIMRYVRLNKTTPPDDIAEKELDYVRELFAIYGEAENIQIFAKEDLKSFFHHRTHFIRQRRDFYAAEDVREGTRLAYANAEEDQFEILKEEVLDSIIDAWENPHPSGLERLRIVLEIAGNLQSDRCWLCKDTDWIGVRQKKGVCHVLVNDGDLEGWLNNRE